MHDSIARNGVDYGGPEARVIRHCFAIAALVFALGCVARTPPQRGLYLVEKGRFQALYGANGEIQRLVLDADGDERAELVILFGDGARPSGAEIDTDGDGVVDRREAFDEKGALRAVTVEAGPKAPPGRGAPMNRSLARPIMQTALALGVGTELNLNRPQMPSGGSR